MKTFLTVAPQTLAPRGEDEHVSGRVSSVLSWTAFEPEQGRRFPLLRLAGTLAWWLESPDHAN